MSSPTQRSLEHCRKQGWPAHVVEKWIPQTRRRLDVWGFGDVLVLDGEPGAMLVQATSTGVAARRTKILSECTDAAKAWLKAGNRIEVWGWTKRVHRNKDGSKSKVKRWTLRTVPVTMEDFA